jgi:hypothetical protein
MSRFLILPGIASVLVFAAIVSVERGARNEPVRTGDSERPMLGIDEVQERLRTRWGELEGSRYAFSRIARPRRQDYRIEILVDNKCEPPHATFAGSIRLSLENGNFPGLSIPPESTLPLLVDRYTGSSLVFKDGSWQEFESWAVSSF